MERVARADLEVFAKRVLARVAGDSLNKKDGATIIALEGDLGAGKTTFTQALARVLGIEEAVQSPTYVLMRSYELKNCPFATLVHIDAYRLESSDEFRALLPRQAGKPNFLHDPKTLVLVEWPERLAGVLPPPDLTLRFSSEGASAAERYIEVI